MGTTDLTVILPAHNEELTIVATIEDIRLNMPIASILVADNCSTDRTRELAIKSGVSVITVDRKGKGNAVRAMMAVVKSPYLIMIDSDYTYPAKYIPKIVLNLSNGADVVMGYRQVVENRALTPINKFGNKALSLLASILYGKYVHDVCTGMWGFRREALKKMSLTSEGFTLEADLFANAVRTKSRIVQIPIYYRARVDGSMTKLKVQDGVKIGWFLLKARFS